MRFLACFYFFFLFAIEAIEIESQRCKMPCSAQVDLLALIICWKYLGCACRYSGANESASRLGNLTHEPAVIFSRVPGCWD
jgi:hypothetical protein